MGIRTKESYVLTKERRLTKEERELVERNHELIYVLRDCMGTDIDDCYDILAIGLCHAAQSYDEKRVGRGFPDYAKVIMLSEYFEHTRSHEVH